MPTVRNKIYILLLCLCICILSACALNPTPSDGQSEASSSPSMENLSSVTDPPTVWKTDSAVQILANGDSFYTPTIEHCVPNADNTLLYYNNLLVAFTKFDLTAEQMDDISSSIGGKSVGVVSGAIHAFQIIVPDTTYEELSLLAEALMERQEVLYACCEYPVQIMCVQADDNPWSYDDTYVESRGNEENPDGHDWWAEAIGAYTAWEYSHLCQKIPIGIIDDGFAADHEDLIGQITFVSNASSNTAAVHGTRVAGIIGAVNNNIGIRGIADFADLYCADLWPLDSPDSYHTLLEYLASVNYMAQCGVRVINNSWGCIVPSLDQYIETVCQGITPENAASEYQMWLEQRVNSELIPTAEAMIVMISQLYASGYEDIIHVQGAGNAASDAKCNGFFSAVTEEVYVNLHSSLLTRLSDTGITFDIIDERILVVGAVQNKRDAEGNYYMSVFSNYGDTVDICAPGDEIFCTSPVYENISYSASAGTSLSAPMVTASVAFLWGLDPEMRVAELRQLLLNTPHFRAIGFGYSYPMLNLGIAAETLLSK